MKAFRWLHQLLMPYDDSPDLVLHNGIGGVILAWFTFVFAGTLVMRLLEYLIGGP